VKAYEYQQKFAHDILPGRIGELLPGRGTQFEKKHHLNGMQYVNRIREQLPEAEEHASPEIKEKIQALMKAMDNEQATKSEHWLSPAEVGEEVNKILHTAHEKGEEVHLTPAIPHGNMWASCYFAMTGFHALHVLGGIVVFVIIWWRGLTAGLNAGDTDTL